MRSVTIGLISAVLCSGFAGAAEEDEQNWCGKLLDLRQCAREVIRIEKIMKERDEEGMRTGRGYNSGNSLVGCSINCARRHIGYEENNEAQGTSCSYSAKALVRFEGLNSAIRRARVIEYVRANCSAN